MIFFEALSADAFKINILLQDLKTVQIFRNDFPKVGFEIVNRAAYPALKMPVVLYAEFIMNFVFLDREITDQIRIAENFQRIVYR